MTRNALTRKRPFTLDWHGYSRYPGLSSFEDNEIHRQLFRGRETDQYDLLQLVLAERLVLLLARSGVGKSSIINAGLMQPLRDERLFPIVVRVSGAGDDPLESFYRGIRAACEQAKAKGTIDAWEPEDALDPRAPNRANLWHFFKTFYIWREDKLLEPVVIIDQFEELFTLISEERRKIFINELADLIRGTRPKRSDGDADPGDEGLSDTLPDVKVVLSIREDFMARLEEMAERIPSILKARFRLVPLTREQARRAIVEPAELELDDSGELATQPFSWSEHALQCALDFLCKRHTGDGGTESGNEVEPFQLQLVCQFAETKVREKALTNITVDDLGGEGSLKRILTRFYQDSLGKLCREFPQFGLRKRLEVLCEYGFITAKGRRLLREESTIERENRISPEILGKMVELRLIRKEPRIGDSYYELTHDTLISPILAARENRESRKRYVRRSASAVVVLVLGVAGFGMYFSEQLESRALIAQRSLDLVLHGANWGDRGNYQLATIFYEAAGQLNPDAVGLRNMDQERDRVGQKEPYGRMLADQAVARVQGTIASAEKLLAGENPVLDTVIVPVFDDLVQTAGMLASRGDIGSADRVYEQARLIRQMLFPAVGEDESDTGKVSESEILPAVAQLKIGIADLLVRASRLDHAMALYATVDSAEVSPEHWVRLCWYGALYGYATLVKDPCSTAVDRIDDDETARGAIFDGRGLVMAQTGDFESAIEDFRNYIAWGENRLPDGQIARRRRWVEQLEAGQNPLSSDGTEIVPLRIAADRVGLLARRDLQLLSLPPQSVMEVSLGTLLGAWASELGVLERLREGRNPLCSNTDPASCDAEWSEGELNGMEEIETNNCSVQLLKRVEEIEGLDELFVTDVDGFNSCMSGREENQNLTSDYYQKDEDWWLDAKDGGRRLRIEHDESANQPSAVSVAIPIGEPAFAGVMKAVFSLDSLSRTEE